MATKKAAAKPQGEKVAERNKGMNQIKTVAEMTDKEIFDAYCRAKRVENASKKQAALLKEVIAARTDKKEGDYAGEIYTIIARSKSRSFISAELVAKYVDADDLPKCYSTTDYIEYRVKGQEEDLEMPEDAD